MWLKLSEGKEWVSLCLLGTLEGVWWLLKVWVAVVEVDSNIDERSKNYCSTGGVLHIVFYFQSSYISCVSDYMSRYSIVHPRYTGWRWLCMLVDKMLQLNEYEMRHREEEETVACFMDI